MKSKKLFVLLAAAVLAVGLASCKKNKGSWNYEECEFTNENASVSVASEGSLANYVASSYEEREKILGLLEEYAVTKNLTGLVLYDDGAYVKYNSRVKIPTKVTGQMAGTDLHDYVLGYGFGIMSEGKLEGDLLDKDGKKASDLTYPTYYHTNEADDPKTLLYMNDKGSVVGNYTGYTFSSYFSTKLKEAADGTYESKYVWYPELATEANQLEGQVRPIPLTKDGVVDTKATLATLATKYRIYVRVGDDLKYSTLGKYKDTYNGRKVALEDYVTPFKELFTQSNGLARGAENLTGAVSIKGTQAYYNASKDGYNEEAWKNVGIKTGSDQQGSYLDFEFNTPCIPFYAMYYLSSSLYAPIPSEFLKEIGGIKIFASFNSDTTLTPVDTTLSTGPYVVESWQPDKEFIFKKNEVLDNKVYGGEKRYLIPGVHVNIFPASKTDSQATFKEYQAGKIDGAGIPKDLLKEQLGTPNTQQTKGSSTSKLNFNTCTQEEWEYLFGEEGIITQTPKSNYWNLKPAMSNDDFLFGLSCAIDRQTYAKNRGLQPSLAYFSDAYLSNPEDAISYNASEAHKNLMAKLYGENWEKNYGYDVNKAVEYFKKAATKLLADGAYKEGDTIELEVCWQTKSQVENNGAEIAKYIEDAFNNKAVCDNKLTLKINNTYTEVWSDVYYKKMMVGQFDIASGGISGNTLNPLNFMEVLKSDNSSGFTLNWGPNTNAVETGLISYDGKQFTYDALFQAADTGAVVDAKGCLAKTVDAALMQNTRNEDGTRTVKIKVGMTNIDKVVKTEVAKVVLCWYDGEEYDEHEVEFTLEGDVLTVVVSQEEAEAYPGSISFDVVFSITVGDADPTEKLISLEGMFPVYA